MIFVPEHQPLLFVDDDDVDRMILASVLERSTLRNDAVFVSNGLAALEHLHDAVAGSRDVPGLVLLDVNMPGLTGFDVLNQLRTLADLLEIGGVVMLSSSDAESDRKRAYELGADSYLCKPSGLARFIELFDENFTNDSF